MINHSLTRRNCNFGRMAGFGSFAAIGRQTSASTCINVFGCLSSASKNVAAGHSLDEIVHHHIVRVSMSPVSSAIFSPSCQSKQTHPRVGEQQHRYVARDPLRRRIPFPAPIPITPYTGWSSLAHTGVQLLDCQVLSQFRCTAKATWAAPSAHATRSSGTVVHF